ncbi:FAD-dependent oxidoreductase [Candidatus Nitrosotenuis chungbukensis]|uniref:FAD-dependent oxidoreductase n=1 Tax=Candidatus Nitrosotenuis chungbukensis TaxID=1353246 RepID=UPI002A4E1E8B|nr:FAD-dependent oxidoreductase [Candidatus Nitrosotenuis chungbukensis]
MTNKRILVLGGGFAGIDCTRALESHFKKDKEAEITLVSEDNFLLFTPMLPQVASGMIETRHIVMPIRQALQKGKILRGQSQKHRPVWKTGHPIRD